MSAEGYLRNCHPLHTSRQDHSGRQPQACQENQAVEETVTSQKVLALYLQVNNIKAQENENQGRIPRTNVGVRRKLTEKEKYEKSLRRRWDESEEKAILEKYTGRRISCVPEEYRKKIEILRSYGYGLTKEEIDEQIFEWIKEHKGTLPRQVIKVKKIPKKTNELTVEEHKEVTLRYRWLESIYRKLLIEYKGKKIEEVPEEYREKIGLLRTFGLDKKITVRGNTYEEIIEWLKTHNGTFPRSAIHSSQKSGTKFVDGKQRTVKLFKYMTDEERYEISLSHRWFKSKEREIFFEYRDKDISEVPEEYRQKIKLLRTLAKSILKKSGDSESKIFEDMILWLEKHNNRPPRAKIYSGGRILNRAEIGEEERYENRLNDRWSPSNIRKILNEYCGRAIEEVPEEYREKIRILREHGMVGKNPIKKRMQTSVKKQVESNVKVRQELEFEVSKEKQVI